MFQRAASILVLLTTLVGLSACGFHSVYGGHGSDVSPVAAQLNQIAIDPIPERAGQMLRNNLIDRMYGKGRPAETNYHLEVSLQVTEENLGTLVNATTALAAIHTDANYVLTDMNGKTLAKGMTNSTAQYNKLTSQYATLAAHDGALERTVREVSEQLTARLSLYFSEPHSPAP